MFHLLGIHLNGIIQIRKENPNLIQVFSYTPLLKALPQHNNKCNFLFEFCFNNLVEMKKRSMVIYFLN